jgi:hypothetical protein
MTTSCDDNCVICLESMNDYQSITLTLMCNHKLHESCFNTMISHTPLDMYPKCPICRKCVGGPIILENTFENIILSCVNCLTLVLFITQTMAYLNVIDDHVEEYHNK